jgi:hypothetical protein
VADAKVNHDPTIVERWLQEQQEWQRTLLAYVDSMVKNDDFLVHLGNAMRGSLLAGKPYPTASAAPAAPAAQDAPPDDRLDRVLFALHEMQGQLNDLRLTLDEVRNGGKGSPSSMPASRPASAKARASRAKAKPTSAKATVGKPRKAARSRKRGKARG